MADVVTKVVPSTAFQEGSATIYVPKIGGSGNISIVRPVFNEVFNSGLTEDKLTNRFDDYNYYN